MEAFVTGLVMFMAGYFFARWQYRRHLDLLDADGFVPARCGKHAVLVGKPRCPFGCKESP